MAGCRCLVTGGAGFVGSYLVDKLLALGHEVVCLDNFDPFYDVRLKRQNVYPFMPDERFTLVEGSILDAETLATCMRNVDCVFHLAAKASVIRSMEEPLTTHEVNATGTLQVLEAARSAGVARVVNISSSAVYGKILHLPLDEAHPTLPLSYYGASKICGENYCDMYRETYGMNVVTLRYFNVYGPRMRPDLATALFTGKAMRGEDIAIFGDGSRSRDFIYTDDVVRATVAAMDRGSGVYNIGSGEAISVKRLAEKIVEVCASPSRIFYIDSVAGEMEHTLADTTRARRELGFEAKVSLEQGLRKFVSSVEDAEKARLAPGTKSVT